jgi:hypothetical protein
MAHHPRILRAPHTQQERRYATTRRANYLPTLWDDLHRCLQRNWKSFRKTQFKRTSK